MQSVYLLSLRSGAVVFLKIIVYSRPVSRSAPPSPRLITSSNSPDNHAGINFLRHCSSLFSSIIFNILYPYCKLLQKTNSVIRLLMTVNSWVRSRTLWRTLMHAYAVVASLRRLRYRWALKISLAVAFVFTFRIWSASIIVNYHPLSLRVCGSELHALSK